MSIQAEQAFIGSILVNNGGFELVPEVEPHHFSHQAHVAIYREVFKSLSTGKSVDAVTLCDRFGKQGMLEEIGGFAYLNELMMEACSQANLIRYAEIILTNFRRQEGKALCITAIGEIESAVDVNEVLADVAVRAERIIGSEQKSSEVSIRDILRDHLSVIEQRHEGQITALPTGLDDLDVLLGGGFGEDDLIVLAARPSMGKTAMALTLGLNVAQADNGPVFISSMEMSRDALMDRAIANVGSIPLDWVKKPQEEAFWPNLTVAVQKIDGMDLVIDDRPARKCNDLVMQIKRMNRKKKLSLILIDYLGLMRGGDPNNRNQELGQYTKALKAVAKETKTPVVLLAQLSREVEKRANKRPGLSDLRDSGEIEADADTVIFLYRDEYYNPDSPDKGVAEIIIAKQRQGQVGFVGAAFSGKFQRFDNLPHGYERSEPEQPRVRRVSGF